VQVPVGLLKATGDFLLVRYAEYVELSPRRVIGRAREAGIDFSLYFTFPPSLMADVSQNTLPFMFGRCLPLFHDLITSFHDAVSCGFTADFVVLRGLLCG